MANYFDALMGPTPGGMTQAGFPYDEPLSTKLMRLLRGDKAGAWPPPEPPPYQAPPPIPGPEDMPGYAPPPAAPQLGEWVPPLSVGGAIPTPPPDPRILAMLTNAQPIRPLGPEGPDLAGLGINLVGPNRSVPPIAGPAPSPQPAPPPAAAPQPAIGGGIERHISELRGNPLFQYAPPASVKPDFHDNLLRFGLAAMAAGGKPMATTLGALGEAGVSTFDANAKAKQSDVENTLAGRKLGVAAQNQISQAYERLDKLKADSINMRLSIEQRAEAAREARALQAQIAIMTNQSRVEANATREDANEIRRGEIEDKSADRKTAEARRGDDLARQTQRDTDTHERDLINQQTKDTMNTVGKTPAQLKMERWSQLDPESRQGKTYAAFKAKEPTLRAQAAAAIAAGRSKADVNKMLTNLGYDPLEP